MLKLSKNIIDELNARDVKKIKIYFYNSWCSGTKVGIIEDDFEVSWLIKLDLNYDFIVYVEQKDLEKFQHCMITKVSNTDHTWKEKVSYIYSSDWVKERCGCGSSFSFEKKFPKLNLDKLKWLKNKF